jgi:hypothetical protein
MATEYRDAPEVAKIAQDLITEHHPRLHAAHIEYIYRNPAASSDGVPKLGTARKISGLNAFLSEYGRPHLVIEIAEEEWQDLTPEQQTALVDHELCHCNWDEEKDEPRLRPHDVEEFGAVIARHGLWSQRLKGFAERGQLRLNLDAGDS